MLIKVTGPAQVIGGRSYCVFSSDDGKAKVPFPATLSFITRNGATKTYDAGCDDSWRDMTDALWLCVFSSDDGKAKVPFPATLSFITRNGATKTYDAGCDDSWRDMTDALWLPTPWTDISGEVGQMDKTTVKFSIPMDNAISLRTVDDNGWFGEVSASGALQERFMFRRRGVTLTKALLTVVCMLAAPLTQAISVGNLTFSLPSETDFVSKRVVNNNKSARIYRIAISAIDSPGSSELRTRPVDGELLFAPRQLALQAGESEYFKFYYHGPRDNRERYYRVSFREVPTRNQTRRSPTGGESYHGPRDNRERYYRVAFREVPSRNLTKRSPTGGEVSTEPVVVMDTILVVRPRQVQFKWSFDKVTGTVSNTGNTCFKLLIKPGCDSTEE